MDFWHDAAAQKRGLRRFALLTGVLLHHGMGAGGVDEIICRGARKDRQHQHG